LISTMAYNSLLAITDKGYTGHEQLDNVGLIHMNGRVYDPTLGRFLSADPNIQAPTNTQSLNRYAYVLNNPLSATDPSGYFSLKKFIAGALSNGIIGEVFAQKVPWLRSAFNLVGCVVGGPLACGAMVAGNSYAAGASTGDALRSGVIAGVSKWAFSPSGENIPSFGEVASRVALNAVAAKNPGFGQALMFVSGNGFDPDSLANTTQNLIGQGAQYAASKELARFAAKHGMTLQELNLFLALNSKIGLKLAGTTFDQSDRKDGSRRVGGFLSRDESGYFGRSGRFIGVLWDINDTVLNAQGLLDAVSLQVINSGYRGHIIGHSLGAARANNLYRQGFISGATTLSLPGFAYPVAGSNSVCGNFDLVCGGAFMTALRPGTVPTPSPSWWNVVGSNHTINTVKGYNDIWGGP